MYAQCLRNMLRRRDKTQMEWATRNQKPSSNSEGEREERRKKRGALKATVCLGFLSPPRPRQTSTPPHTRAPPTKFTNPPEAQKFPWEEKSRAKSGAPNPSDPEALPRARPESCKSPLKFPNPPRVAAAAAAFPATDPPPRRSRCRDFQIHLRCFVSPPLCYCRHELSRPARHRGPSRACEARGSLPRKSPLVERRRPLFLAAPALCWCLSGVGVEIHPGVYRFLSFRW